MLAIPCLPVLPAAWKPSAGSRLSRGGGVPVERRTWWRTWELAAGLIAAYALGVAMERWPASRAEEPAAPAVLALPAGS